MAKKLMTQALTVGDKGRVTLPEELRIRLGIEVGAALIPEVTDRGTLELVPAALIPRDQIWFAHPDMQARIAEAHSDIVARRTVTIGSTTDLDALFEQIDKAGRDD